MAEAEEDRAKRSAGLVPYGLLSPGVLWLLLFFLVPLVTLARTSLSVKTSRFDPNDIDFTGELSNYTNALSDYSEQFIRSFVYAGTAGWMAICRNSVTTWLNAPGDATGVSGYSAASTA